MTKSIQKTQENILDRIDAVHTTPEGAARIKRNLGLPSGADAVAWCKRAVLDAEKTSLVITLRRGKNWYIDTPDIEITVNAESLTIITAHKLKTKVRPIAPSEFPVLNEFLYQAIFVPEGVAPPPRTIVNEPEIFIYIKDFGKRAGDYCVVAERGGQIVGAAWSRIIPAYGHTDNRTPELAIAVFPEYRGKGIGTKLMNALCKLLRQGGYEQLSLSVQKDNPAVRFYKRLGFTASGERIDPAGHADYLMIKNLTV